jgi:hypothetical protein
MIELKLFNDKSPPPDGLLDAIIDFDEFYEGDLTYVSVGAVVFKKDFGPWKAGDRADNILLDYVGGYIEQSDDRGNLIQTVKVKLAVDTERT